MLLAPDGVRVADDDASRFKLWHPVRPCDELDAIKSRSDGVLLLVGHLDHPARDFPNRFAGKMCEDLHFSSSLECADGENLLVERWAYKSTKPIQVYHIQQLVSTT